jgi:cytochrome c oxidase subunit IV
MTGHAISTRTYVTVCAGLILLTFLTVGVSLLDIAGYWHITLGLVIAVCKASLVVLFFMHVIVSSRLTRIVIIVSVFWLLLLVSLTMTDYVTRNLIPTMQGH